MAEEDPSSSVRPSEHARTVAACSQREGAIFLIAGFAIRRGTEQASAATYLEGSPCYLGETCVMSRPLRSV